MKPLLATAMLILWASAGGAFDKVNRTTFGTAIKGYDTVAYHTEGRAVKGDSKYSYEWNDAKWYFKNAENRDLFAANPEKYAPQYGGYWAGSLATTGKVAGVDPTAFKIIDGKLYLSWNKETADQFAASADILVKKADDNWQKLNK